ncbi:MAG: AAA family ATPase [Candidatus Altiarchaeota archaeon]
MELNGRIILRELPDKGEVRIDTLAEVLGFDRKSVLESCMALSKDGYVEVRKPLFRKYRISRTEKRMGRPGKCRVISVSNHKGGVGKTTTAINVSASLAELGKKVLLVDLDPQANATTTIGRGKNIRYNIYDVLSLTVPAAEGVVETDYGFSLLPSEVGLVGLEVELSGIRNREHRLDDVITDLRSAYDYIIIDCPPSLSILAVNALTASDSVLIPVQSDQYAIESISTLTRIIELVKDRLNESLEIEGALITMHEPESEFSRRIAEEVRRRMKETVLDVVIERDPKVSEAAGSNMPLIKYDQESKAAKAYMELSRKLISDEREG